MAKRISDLVVPSEASRSSDKAAAEKDKEVRVEGLIETDGFGDLCGKCGGLMRRFRSAYNWNEHVFVQVDICGPCRDVKIRAFDKFDA
jgi:hypothetical protein